MYDPTIKQLYAGAIGEEVVRYLDSLGSKEYVQFTESRAISLICEIKAILDDHTLSDPDCFYRIDAIVDAFHNAGLSTERHWEVE